MLGTVGCTCHRSDYGMWKVSPWSLLTGQPHLIGESQSCLKVKNRQTNPADYMEVPLCPPHTYTYTLTRPLSCHLMPSPTYTPVPPTPSIHVHLLHLVFITLETGHHVAQARPSTCFVGEDNPDLILLPCLLSAESTIPSHCARLLIAGIGSQGSMRARLALYTELHPSPAPAQQPCRNGN